MYCASLCLVHAMDPTLAQGHSRVKVSMVTADATSFFDYEELAGPLNLTNRPAEYSEDVYQLEYTYGYRNDIAIVFRTETRGHVLSSSSEEVKQSGISGYYLAVRQAIPMGQGSRMYSETGVRVAEDHDEPLPVSPGGTSWYALVSYDQDFLPSKAGFSMDFGYVFGGGAEDEVVFDTELILDFLRVVNLSLGYHVLESRKDKKEPYTPLQWPNERGFQAGEVMLHRDLGRSFRLSLGYQTRFKGRNQFETDSYKLDFSWWFGPNR